MRQALVTAAAIILCSTSAFAQGTPEVSAAPVGPSDASPSLKSELDSLRKDHAEQLAQLRARVEAGERALAEERTRTTVKETASAGPFVRVGDFNLTLSGFFHGDFLARIPAPAEEVSSAGQPTNETRFLIKRARLRADLRWKMLSGGIEFDGNTSSGPAARIQGAEVAIRWAPRQPDAVPYLMVTMGLFKMTFGYEIMQLSDKERLFLERSSVMRALFPGEYDLGVKVQGGYRYLRYAFALMNGAPMADKQFALRDPNRSKDFLGRIGIDTGKLGRISIAAGVSCVYGQGFHQGATASDGTLVWTDANGDKVVDAGELSQKGAHVASASSGFRRWAVGGDLQLRVLLPKVGTLMVYGELVGGANLDRGFTPADPVALGRDLSELGGYIGVTQELTKWAMLGVRYDEFRTDRDAPVAPSTGTPAPSEYQTVAVSVAARYLPHGRLIAEYDHNRTGTRDGATGVIANKNDHLVGVRAELVF